MSGARSRAFRGFGALAVVLGAAATALPGGSAAREETARPPAPWRAPLEARERRNPVAPAEASIERGRLLYTEHCLSCHGGKGSGDGPVARRLGFEAGDLTSATKLSSQPDGALFWKIATGRDPMPAFKEMKGLTDPQIWDLVNFVRTLSRDGGRKVPADP